MSVGASNPSRQPSGQPPTLQRVSPSSPKILRACVVQGGKVIEEQRLRRREPLEQVVQLVGDDLFVTNTARIRQGIDQKAATAVGVFSTAIARCT